MVRRNIYFFFSNFKFSSRDKLSTYLMLKLYDNDDRERASSVPNWKSVRSFLK
jgi:hypothetical protein